jgi:hypothetical protein
MSYENLSMVELREMCARLRITPGRSKAETITRIEAEDRREAEAADAAASAIVVNGDVLPADSEEAQIILNDPLPEIIGVDYGHIEARVMAHMVAGGAQVADIMNAPYGNHAPVTGGFTTEVRADGRRHVTGTYDTPKTKAQRQRDVRRKMRKATRRAQRRSA